MALLIAGMWAISVVAGWYLWWWWLPIPVAVMGVIVGRQLSRMNAVARYNGLTGDRMRKSMIGPTARLLVAALLQHGVLFGLGAGLHKLMAG